MFFASQVRFPLASFAITGAAGTAAALYVWFRYASGLDGYSDFDLIWLGARALLAGENPYLTLADYRWPILYPLPAFLLGIPLAPLSVMGARCTFAFLTAAAATWALWRHRGPASLLLIASWPFAYALQRGQWSPLVLAACLVPAWGLVAAAKPSVGLGAILYHPTRVGLIGAGALTLTAVLVLPHWPLDWLAEVSQQRHMRSPILLPGGFLLAAATLRWRRPEARLFLVLAVVPQTIVPYELVPLAVVPRTRREFLFIAVSWMAAYVGKMLINPVPLGGQATLPVDYFPQHWWAMLLCGYLPALALILRRTNMGEKSGSAAETPPGRVEVSDIPSQSRNAEGPPGLRYHRVSSRVDCQIVCGQSLDAKGA